MVKTPPPPRDKDDAGDNKHDPTKNEHFPPGVPHPRDSDEYDDKDDD